MDTPESGHRAGAPRFETLAGGPPAVWLSAQELIKRAGNITFRTLGPHQMRQGGSPVDTELFPVLGSRREMSSPGLL